MTTTKKKPDTYLTDLLEARNSIQKMLKHNLKKRDMFKSGIYYTENYAFYEGRSSILTQVISILSTLIQKAQEKEGKT